MQNEKGFTLIELLVAMFLVAVIGLAALSFMSSAFGRLSLESRAAVNAQEVQNALKLLSGELRMSHSISPYLPGIDPSVVNCANRLSVAADTVSFLVPHENAAATTGITAYHVGYSYDSVNSRLLRGAVAGTTTANCGLPAGDPFAAGTAQLLAENVVQIDSDHDGALDPIFSISGTTVKIRVGVVTEGRNGTSITQQLATNVKVRAG